MNEQCTSDTATRTAQGCGRVLSRARHARRLTGVALAAQAGLSRRTLSKIEHGDAGVAMGSYLSAAANLNAAWLFEVVSCDPAPSAAVPRFYLSGASALSLPPTPQAHPALWYSSALTNPRSWQVAGMNLNGASALLGVQGLWDATEPLRLMGLPVERVWAANYERAVFDLLYHFCELRSTALPNLQVSDIDDVVDIAQVSEWVTQAEPFLSPQGVKRMVQWLGR